MYLQLDESNDTDPFVCFRRRDAKAVRKTRRADNTPADKITRLRIELQQVSDLAANVVTREMKKAELGRDTVLVLEARLRLVDHKRRFPHLCNPQDDQSPYATSESIKMTNPCERAAAILREIERQYKPRKQSGWEDYLDVSTLNLLWC